MVFHGLEIRKSVFWWTKMDMVGCRVVLDECIATVNMMKQSSSDFVEGEGGVREFGQFEDGAENF